MNQEKTPEELQLEAEIAAYQTGGETDPTSDPAISDETTGADPVPAIAPVEDNPYLDNNPYSSTPPVQNESAILKKLEELNEKIESERREKLAYKRQADINTLIIKMNEARDEGKLDVSEKIHEQLINIVNESSPTTPAQAVQPMPRIVSDDEEKIRAFVGRNPQFNTDKEFQKEAKAKDAYYRSKGYSLADSLWKVEQDMRKQYTPPKSTPPATVRASTGITPPSALWDKLSKTDKEEYVFAIEQANILKRQYPNAKIPTKEEYAKLCIQANKKQL